MSVTAIERFAEFGSNPGQGIADPQVLHHARRAMVDWHAAWIAGSVAAPATLLEHALAEDLDHGHARLASGRRATARAAALINGTAAHTVEVDDIFKLAIYHPGAPTIAAALAAAQAESKGEVSGSELLRAVIVGYEISTRIGAALGREHYRYWHSTGTVGTFGAAAAVAALYRLDARHFANALATAATFAAGLQQAFRRDSMSKPLHAGRAAEGGLLAAQMARAGITGSSDVLDGEVGLGHAMSVDPDWSQALASLGRDYHVTHMTFKNHACCGHTFAPIDGALDLQGMAGMAAADIRKVVISTYRSAIDVAGNPQPATAAQARFSIPFVVASALLYGSVRPAAFSAERLADPGLRALMEKVTLQVDPALDALFPGQRAARVAIETRDGRHLEHLQPHRKGDPEQPLSDDELSAKFRELVEPVIGSDRAIAMLRGLWHLDEATTSEVSAA
jgi:2-methylcitrate dehydratase PrpD